MKQYIGTKVLSAEPMTRGEYNTFRGWAIPVDEDPNDPGFLVRYMNDGYISWSPADVFNASYNEMNAMNFGDAVHFLKAGKAVARRGWNGKGMFLYLVPAPEQGYPAQTGVAKAYWGDKALVPYGAYIAMKTADENVVPWLASQTDVLAEDWVFIEHPEDLISSPMKKFN